MTGNMKDKICVDTNDAPELSEFFSRKAAGDKVCGRFEGTMDENADGVVILSIADLKLELSKDAKPKGDGDGDEPAAVKVARKKVLESEDVDEGL